MTTPANQPDALLAFLRARYDEREQKARAATPGPWRTKGLPYDYAGYDDDPAIIAADGRWVAGLAYDGLSTSTAHEVDEDGAHIAANDPAWVLADLDSKRRILDLCAEVIGDRDLSDYDRFGSLAQEPNAMALFLAVETVRSLAAPFAGHPDYRPEWRPA